MMYLFNYRDVKLIQRDRTKRSLQRLASSGRSQPDSYRRPTPEAKAEVVELVFATACDTDRIGA